MTSPIDGHLVKCRDALMSTPELNDIDLNPDSPEHQAAYDMCLLSKLGVTMRETMVWCEHKGSLVRIFLSSL
ncbi:hypothetical protein V5799_028395 [Amblyomma americanum]|uniref:Uncharacterized protein n=1 Tax=Amblyomma americanum TaxID=6943 RepID=A0AAQ4DD01_AMBAM